MPFADPEYVTARITADRAELLEPLVYKGDRDTFTVPVGFVTDFATVPQPVAWFIPRMGVYTRAAIVHDWLCSGLGTPAGAPVSAREADGVFRRIMREEGVPPLRRRLMWTAVRWGALANPARRDGWWRDAPAVLGLTVLALPFVLPASLLAAAGTAVYAVLEVLVRGVTDDSHR